MQGQWSTWGGIQVHETILIADDEPSIRELLAHHLEQAQFHVLWAADGPATLESAANDHPDLIILDAMLPEISGFDVLRRLRSQIDVPVIMLTARRDEVDRVVGLELGADDYVTKPFSVRELLARIHAILRRQHAAPVQSRVADEGPGAGVRLNFEAYTVTVNEQPVMLTMTEFQILALLMKHPKRAFSRQEIASHVWPLDVHHDTNSINVHISNLRDKLGSAASMIETVRGVGYRLATPSFLEPDRSASDSVDAKSRSLAGNFPRHRPPE
jgi:two-component system alkaline phosphatase synthesis response regulator PhoP